MNMLNNCAVETESLVKAFGAFTAVDDVTLRVAKGEIFGFLGPKLIRCDAPEALKAGAETLEAVFIQTIQAGRE